MRAIVLRASVDVRAVHARSETKINHIVLSKSVSGSVLNE